MDKQKFKFTLKLFYTFKALDLHEQISEIAGFSRATFHEHCKLFGVMILFGDTDRARIFEIIQESKLEMSQISELLCMDQFYVLSELHDWTKTRRAKLMHLRADEPVDKLVSDQLKLLIETLQQFAKFKTMLDTTLSGQMHSNGLKKCVLKYVWKRFPQYSGAEKVTKMIADCKWSTIDDGEAVIYAINNWLLPLVRKNQTIAMINQVFGLFDVFSTSRPRAITGAKDVSSLVQTIYSEIPEESRLKIADAIELNGTPLDLAGMFLLERGLIIYPSAMDRYPELFALEKCVREGIPPELRVAVPVTITLWALQMEPEQNHRVVDLLRNSGLNGPQIDKIFDDTGCNEAIDVFQRLNNEQTEICKLEDNEENSRKGGKQGEKNEASGSKRDRRLNYLAHHKEMYMKARRLSEVTNRYCGRALIDTLQITGQLIRVMVRFFSLCFFGILFFPGSRFF